MGGCVELFGEVDPVPGGSSASGDHDELVASFLQLYEGVCVFGVGVGGVDEEASAEADGGSHGWVLVWFVFMWLGAGEWFYVCCVVWLCWAGVPEWPKGRDSRSCSSGFRGFESLPPHFRINPRLEESLDRYQEYLRDKGLRDSTIETKTKLIRILRKRVGGLWDSDQIGLYIRRSSWDGRRKNIASYAYRDWCRWKGFDYDFERVREPDPPLPYIPTERELDQLIAGMSHKYATFLQLLKESAFRPGEAMRLTPRDVDLEKRLVTLNAPEKNSRPRQFKMSMRLAQMMSEMIVSTPITQRIWNSKYECLHRTFSLRRRALAEKLKNPNLLRISFKTFRHWKATTEYHRTKDILHVMRLLGHKNIQNTLVYTHLIDTKEDQWISKVAHNSDEACRLVEAGFEFVCLIQNEEMIFRKRV